MDSMWVRNHGEQTDLAGFFFGKSSYLDKKDPDCLGHDAIEVSHVRPRRADSSLARKQLRLFTKPVPYPEVGKICQLTNSICEHSLTSDQFFNKIGKVVVTSVRQVDSLSVQ